MIRRTTLLDNLAVLFVLLIIVGIIGALVMFGARAIGLNRQSSHLISVPNDYPTIQAAINAAVPGDIIRVSAGAYVENLTLTKPVSLIAETFDQVNPLNNRTIIDGGTGGATILIPAGLTQMPVIRGFVIQNGTDGINAQSQFIAEYNYFHASAAQVNYQTGAGGINRDNVYFSALDDAIHVDNLNRSLLIESNRILYARDDGIEMNLQNTTAPTAVIDVSIWNNMIIGSGEDGIQFVDSTDNPQDINHRFTVMGNLIANNKKAGIGLMPNGNTVEDYSGANTVEPVRAFNNTFYGNDYGISGGNNLVVFNSMFVNSTTRGIWNVQGPVGANAIVAYSLFFNNSVDAEQSTIGVGVISGQDPLFQAVPNPGPDGAWGTVDDDFSGLLLQPGSPAIDKGIAQYVPNDGELIPSSPITGFTGGAPDLGWREFGSPLFITPAPSLLTPTTPLATLTPVTPTATPLPVLPTVISPTIPPTVTLVPLTPLPSATVPAAIITSTAAPMLTPTPQVAITSIFPNSAPGGSTVNVTITGSAFTNGAVVTFEGGHGSPPQVLAAQVVNPTTIVITVNVTADATLGTQVWDLRVTNRDASSVVLPHAFTVVVS